MTSTIKVNNIQNQCGQNIINENSNTITIGASGDTIALASGASQTGFGRTGTVDWQTGSIKTATFTAANGEGYFVNTTGGTVTVNLPSSPSAGNIVAISDYAGTANTNNITIGRNGSNIEGDARDGAITNNRDAITLVYVDGTQGWVPINDNESTFLAPTFICASVSGACNTLVTAPDCANTKIATFTGPGTFTVNSLSSISANNEVSYVIVAGGGGSGGTRSHIQAGGGGGAGGFREVKNPATPYTASPLDGYPTPGNRITVTATGFPITVGAGGTAGGSGGGHPTVPDGPASGNGGVSTFSTITSAGGGGGGQPSAAGVGPAPGHDGGSGGGGGGGNPARPGGSGNTPPTSPAQGTNGGTGQPGGPNSSGSGGGATGAGVQAPISVPNPAGGGAGATSSITSSPVTYAGGGNYAAYCGPTFKPVSNATANTGNGANANNGSAPGNMPFGDLNTYWNGRVGGSGIVIIRYKFQ